MASVEKIALLCAGTTKYHQQGGRSSSKDNLSRAELAGLLSGLGSMAMNLALAKYACDLEAERMLMAQVRVWAAGLAVDQSWKIIKGVPSLCNMSAMAVLEVTRPNRCPRCKGRGMMVNKVCPVCGGSGYHHLSGRVIAEAIGVEHSNYIRTWKSRYEQALNYLQDIDSKIGWCLFNATREPDYEPRNNRVEKKIFTTAPICEYIFP